MGSYGHEKAPVIAPASFQMCSISEMCLPVAKKPWFHAGLRDCRYEHSYQMMCGRFLGIFVCIPKVGHTLIFRTKNERSRYDWLCFVLCNSCSTLELELNFQWWYADAFHYRKRYNPGERRSNRSYLHNGSGEFPPLSNWQRKIPSERCHRELPERRKIALLHNRGADF